MISHDGIAFDIIASACASISCDGKAFFLLQACTLIMLLHGVFPIGSLCVDDDDDIVPFQSFVFMHLVAPCRIDNF